MLKQKVFKSKYYFKNYLMSKLINIIQFYKFHRNINYTQNSTPTLFMYIVVVQCQSVFKLDYFSLVLHLKFYFINNYCIFFCKEPVFILKCHNLKSTNISKKAFLIEIYTYLNVENEKKIDFCS